MIFLSVFRKTQTETGTALVVFSLGSLSFWEYTHYITRTLSDNQEYDENMYGCVNVNDCIY